MAVSKGSYPLYTNLSIYKRGEDLTTIVGYKILLSSGQKVVR